MQEVIEGGPHPIIGRFPEYITKGWSEVGLHHYYIIENKVGLHHYYNIEGEVGLHHHYIIEGKVGLHYYYIIEYMYDITH